jgi:hypothetical protein
MYSYSQQGNSHPPTTLYQSASQTSLTFRSPLFRLRRAPLLRVFVPSPEGDWLSDKSVLECEAECKRAGIAGLMRLGDVVWDVAVGDEGNVGRLVWDGSYLIVSLPFIAPPSLLWSAISLHLYTEIDFTPLFLGSGLHVFDHWRSAQVPSDVSFPAIVFPSRDTHRRADDEPHCAH